MAKAIDKSNRYYAENRAAWRKWLEENHDSCTSVWLIYYKVSSGKSRVTYDEAVEEALCFGWIDSTMNPLDEHSYMQLFTPRKPKSGWSKLNKDRVSKLEAQGLLTPAGIAKITLAKENGSWNHLDHIEAFVLPSELIQAFEEHPEVKLFYDKQSMSIQKMMLYYMHNAKRSETRAKRIEEIVTAAKNNRLPDRWIPVPKNK